MSYQFQPSLYVPGHARPRPEVRPLPIAHTGLSMARQSDANFTSPPPLANVSPPPILMPSFAPAPPDEVRIVNALSSASLWVLTHALLRQNTFFGLFRMYAPRLPPIPFSSFSYFSRYLPMHRYSRKLIRFYRALWLSPEAPLDSSPCMVVSKVCRPIFTL